MKFQTPAFQFYPGDWLSSPQISMMTPAQEGAYIRLLAYDWGSDGIPDDPKAILKLSRLDDENALAMLLPCFCHHPRRKGFLTNKRLEHERAKQKSFAEMKSRAGKSGAQVRWGKEDKMPPHDSVIVLPMANDSSSSSSSSSSSKTTTTFPAQDENLAPVSPVVETPEIEKQPRAKPISKPWEEGDIEFLRILERMERDFPVSFGCLKDFAWWESVAKALTGLTPEFLEMELSRMKAWLIENPSRCPTERGLRRFVRQWLERSKEQRRIQHGFAKREFSGSR